MSTNKASSDTTCKRAVPDTYYPAPQEIKENDSVILVFGLTSAGKTTLVNALAEAELEVGDSVDVCTSDIQTVITEFKGRRVAICETPAFDDSHEHEASIFNKIVTFLRLSDMTKGLNGVIYVHDFSQLRMTGTARKNLKLFKLIVGHRAFNKVVFVLNKWPSPHSAKELKREAELKQNNDFFGTVIQAGAHTVRVGQNPERNDVTEILDRFLDSEATPLLLQEELRDGRNIIDTSAGKFLGEGLRQFVEENNAEIQQIGEEMAGQTNTEELESLDRELASFKYWWWPQPAKPLQ